MVHGHCVYWLCVCTYSVVVFPRKYLRRIHIIPSMYVITLVIKWLHDHDTITVYDNAPLLLIPVTY